MTAEHPPLRLIVDRRARGVQSTTSALVEALRTRDVAHDTATFDAPGQGEQQARAALREGVRFLVAVGDDRTIGEVVNGMFTLPDADADAGAVDAGGALQPVAPQPVAPQPVAPQPVAPQPLVPDALLGAVGVAGCDFVRTFGLDRAPATVAEHLAGPHSMPIDVGVARYRDREGRPAVRLFVNIAEAGYHADLLRRARRLRLLGRVGALLAAYAAIPAVRRERTAVEVAHTTTNVPLVGLVAANCQFFGDGLKVAPRALPDDGVLNVQVFTGERSQMFTATPRIFRGEHLPDPHIVEYQSPFVALAPPQPVHVAADGEILGTTPARFSLLPRALRLKI